MKDLFKTIIKDFISRDLSSVYARDYPIPTDISRIVTLSGARRTGKTWLLFSLIKSLRNQVPTENLVYINFEDDRLFPLTGEKLSQFTEAYYELFPDRKNQWVWFFFDEVQNATQWETYIRRIYDTERCRIYITGSSSRLLSSEIATSLRGRTLNYTIFPLSFREYIRFVNLDTDTHRSASKAAIINAFNHYATSSAFPEILTFDEPTQLRALHDYADLIVYKDLIDRHNISNRFLIKYFVKHLITNISSPLSVNKCFNDFKSQGLQVSRDTLFQYLDFLQEAGVIFTVPLFTENLREQNRNPVKIYAVDTGLHKIFTHRHNVGKIYENIVFLELCRRGYQIAYYKGKQEIDFVAHNHKETLLINVTSTLDDPQTLQREISGLAEAMATLNIKQSTLLTMDTETTYESPSGTIQGIPAWKWLLDN